MSQLLTFILIGLGAGAAFAAIGQGLVVTYKGTGTINFAAGAMAAWGAYVFDELQRTGDLHLPVPVNHRSQLGADGYGGFPLVFFTAVSVGLAALLLTVLVVRPISRRRPGLARPVAVVAGAVALAWAVFVFTQLRSEGRFWMPVIPYRVHLGEMAFLPALLLAAVVAAVLGLAAHLLIFRPLRTAPPLAKVVASVGLMTTLQALVAFRFGSVPRNIKPIFPNEKLELFGGVEVARDRLFVALAAIVVGVLLWAYFRWTRPGLATRAAAENERNAALGGWSPDVLAASTWVIASVSMTVLVILTLPIIPLSPTMHTLMIVPALACALVGRLTSLGTTVAAGLVLGSLQSVFTLLSGKPWWPDWAVTGLGDAVPFVVLIVVLFVLGKSLPTRGALSVDALPDVIVPKNRPQVIVPLVAVAAVLLVVTSGGYRFGLITSMIVTIAALSIVLLTGLIGQISLAQAALAGTAGFALSKLSDGAGLGFPWSMLLAGLVAAGFGVLIGIPALRIRGAQLAVVTLAAAVALERFVFRNPRLSPATGNPIPNVKLFGLDLSMRSGSTIARWQFGFLVLAILVICALAVSNLMRSATGRRFLAVRNNERAGAAAGINVSANKLLAFGVASFLAGISGALIGYSRGQLSADSFSTFVNISFLAFAYLGGITSVSGALVAGTLAPLGIGYVISDRLLEAGSVYTLMAGLSLISTAIFNPIGIAGATRANMLSLLGRFSRRPSAADAAPAVSTSHDHAAGNGHAPGESAAGAPAYQRPIGPRAERAVRLRTTDLTVRYGGVVAVDRVTLQIHEGEVVGLIGPNGAGKTSFMDGLTGFTAASGAVEFDGNALENLAPHARARRGLARTWQSVELFGDLSVRDNIRVACEPSSITSFVLDLVHPRRDTDHHEVDRALEMVGLSHLADERPDNLSLGQQKLLGVARALAARPGVVLMDEPAAGLDTTESQELGDRLREIVAEGTSVFLIDHDMGLVLDVCDYIYVLEFGTLIAEGTPTEIRANPAVIQAYLGSSGHSDDEQGAELVVDGAQ